MAFVGFSSLKGFGVFILSIVSIQGIGADKIDLPQAINYALTQNRELALSMYGTEYSAFEMTKAETEFQLRFQPDVSLGLSGGRSTVNYGFNASKKLPWGTVLTARSNLQKDRGDTSDPTRIIHMFEIQQPLFRNFGSLIHKESLIQAGHDLMTAQRQLEMRRADLVVGVVDIYEKILQLKRQVNADKESFSRMDGLYRVTKAKEVLGRTTRIDTLRVELLRGQASLRLKAAQERLQSESSEFAELLGFSPEKNFDLQPTPLLTYKVPAIKEAVHIALQNRMDYAQILQDTEDSQRGEQIAQKNLFPDVSLIARKEWYGQGTNLFKTGSLESIWFVGLSVDMDFNLKRERAALGQAYTARAAASKSSEILEISIYRQVSQQILAYNRAMDELKIADRNFNLAKARAKLAQRLFELGRGDNFSVTDSEEAYLNAENQWLSSRAEASRAGYRLSYVLGTLIESPEELKPKSKGISR